MRDQNPQTTKPSSGKSRMRVKNQDRDYLDQVDLHSSEEQETFNQGLASMTETQLNLAVSRMKTLMKQRKG